MNRVRSTPVGARGVPEAQLRRQLERELASQGCKTVAREWPSQPGRPQNGVGDLVMRLPDNKTALVVEVKGLNPHSGHTARVSRNHARSQVVEQAGRYGAAWKALHPAERVVSATFTSGEPLTVVEEFP
jgi:Holliday junction resolvase-like predicted endonuclease